jgi:hypothetical protein
VRKRHVVVLPEAERARLHTMIGRGVAPASALADRATLEREVAAWQAARNRASRGVNWRFTTEDARIKLKHLYPTTQD